MKFKATFLILGLLVGTLPLWAGPQAVLSSLKGKVEVKAPGTKAWVAATEGQVLTPATTLSTGFDSSVLVVIDKTTIQVKPLTRMTIDKLVEESGTVKTSTFLRVGSVSASVKSAEGVKQDFKVQSPYSTASVRGTEFDFDGLRLKVREGLVALILGRPKRDTQPVEAVAETTTEETPAEGTAGEDTTGEDTTDEPAAEETDGEPAGEPEDDFVGSPDIAADDDNPVFVPAGDETKIKLNFNNPTERTRPSSSNDRESLSKESGTGSSQTTTNTPTTKAPTKGGVVLTIEFAR